MKKALRDSHAIFGGELSGHFYYRDNYCADSGLITFVHMLNIISQTSSKVSELIKPLRRYFASGEINFQVEDKKAGMDELAKRYRDGQVDSLDGVTVGYKDWWFNCRPSNTEPLLRLTVEARTEELLQEKLAEIQTVLGPPVVSHVEPPVVSRVEPPVRHEKTTPPSTLRSGNGEAAAAEDRQQKQPVKKPDKKRKQPENKGKNYGNQHQKISDA
jgi:hypothetical protein